MALLLLHNARVILEAGIQIGGVLVREGRIALVFARDKTPTGLSARESIDLGGAYLGAGLIDIHIHGSAGVDVQATDAEGLRKRSEILNCGGETRYLSTLVPTND